MNMDNLMKTLLSTLLAIIGFFLVFEFTKMNSNIVEIQKEITEVKMQIVSVQEKMLTEERIRSICVEEILKNATKK